MRRERKRAFAALLLLIGALFFIGLFLPLPRRERVDCSPCVEGQICPACASERWRLETPLGIKLISSFLLPEKEKPEVQEKLPWEPRSTEVKTEKEVKAKVTEIPIKSTENQRKTWEDREFQIEIEPYIGGGFMGATSIYVINSKGEVYLIHSPNYQEPTKKELVKQVDKNLVDSLRDLLIKARVFEMEEGFPQYGGRRWQLVINGEEKTLYFLQTPESLFDAEKILKEIGGSDF